MEELLNAAQTDWKFKRKDEAFAKVLGALALISAGTGKAIKTAEDALAAVEELKKQ